MIYVIYDMTNVASIDFSQVGETSQDTLRLSLDGTKTILKFIGETPSFLNGKTIYTHAEILVEMAKSDWSEEE
jgi:hypothetical protein